MIIFKKPSQLLLLTIFFITTNGALSLNAMNSASREEEYISEQPDGQQEYDIAYNLVDQNTPETVKDFFKKQDRKSIRRMALRFAYAQKYKKNIDAIKCVSFLRDCKEYWVNTENYTAYCLGSFLYHHELLSEKYLKYVIPLLEPLLKEPVTILHLPSTSLKSLPENLRLLRNLEFLDFYEESKKVDKSNAMKLGLQTLPKWLAKMPSLQLNGILISNNMYLKVSAYDAFTTANIEVSRYTKGRMLQPLIPPSGLIL